MPRSKYTFYDKLLEFLGYDNLNKFKFNMRYEIKFKDGTSMPVWWSANKKDILSLNNDLGVTALEQYNKYKTSIKWNTFDERIKEFEAIDDLNKFDATNRAVKFKDDTFAGPWFHSHQNRILNDDKYSVLKKQYTEYRHMTDVKKDIVFKNKMIEFCNCDDEFKFDNNHRDSKFSDGTIMTFWFMSFKDQIFELDNPYAIEIKKQYANYKSIHGISNKVSFEDRLKEFYEDKDLNKYNVCGEPRYFSDGANKGTWFSRYVNVIKNSTDIMSLTIMRDHRLKIGLVSIAEKYNHLINNYNNISKEEFDNIFNELSKIKCGKHIPFEVKLSEFEKETNILKFRVKNDLQFSFGGSMWNWFNVNRDRIFKESKVIEKQYEYYRKKYRYKKKIDNDDKITKRKIDKKHAFMLEEDHNKFSIIGTLTFEDGCSMFKWFEANIRSILSSDDEDSIVIQEQYKKHKEYLAKQKEARFLNKLEEFSMCEDLNKYRQRDRSVTFKDGTKMSLWFKKYFNKLINMDNEEAIKILIDFYEYKNDEDNITLYKDKLDGKQVILKH